MSYDSCAQGFTRTLNLTAYKWQLLLFSFQRPDDSLLMGERLL
jgi:hypothetical protein